MANAVWIHYCRPRPHWYGLSEDEKATKLSGWAKLNDHSISIGATRIGRYHVRGQHDFQTVEIWNFPTPDAAFEHWSRLTSAAYNEWFAFSNNIGLDEGNSDR